LSGKSLRVSIEAAPVRKQTADNLRAAILDGRFQPGQRLNEKELCEMTGVSRTSVREALRQLEAECLVTTLPNKGPVVSEVTYEDAEAIYEVREQLEGLAVRLFAQRADDPLMMTLEFETDRLARAHRSGDVDEYLQAKRSFYDVLLKGCGNPIVYEILHSLLARINYLRRTSLAAPDRVGRSIAELSKMVGSIQKRDAQAAYEACQEHVRNAAAAALPALRHKVEDN